MVYLNAVPEPATPYPARRCWAFSGEVISEVHYYSATRFKITIIIKYIILFALLFGLVSINKEVFRPNFSHIPLANILTGSFPNFIAAFIISLAFINAVLTKNSKHGRVIVYISSALVFTFLTIEEIKPIWGASEHFDSYDILASRLGSLFSISTFEIIVFSRKHKLK